MSDFHALDPRSEAAGLPVSQVDLYSSHDRLAKYEKIRAHDRLLPDSLTFPTLSFKELDTAIDPATHALWCYMRPKNRPSFTPNMLLELNTLHRAVDRHMRAPGQVANALQYYVMGSRIPSIYNLGGELVFLVQKIREGDRESVRKYAHSCIDAVHAIYHGFHHPIISIGLVQGDALGGGLEGALCFNVIIAERGVKMGLPEVLFGSFPGMGAYSFLARKIGAVEAEKMIMSGRIYTAEEFHEMGIVDVLADKGRGVEAVNTYIETNGKRHRLLTSMQAVRHRVNPLTIHELRDITDIWVENMMALGDSDLRRMERLANAQNRRLGLQ